MTERLYYTDSYRREFDANVRRRSPDGLQVVLDRTAFYPTSGGQQFDTGTLDGVAVTDVMEVDDDIVHVLSAQLESEAVSGRINWPRRFDHMQQHTGQHLLSAVFEDLFGFRTASVHFGEEGSSLDLETGAVSPAQLVAAESRANEIVWENRGVTVAFEDASTVTGLRKPPPREGEIRIVSIDSLDRSACGGTHVSATGEIGVILLGRQERIHGNVRIEFVCGGRALRRARSDHDAISHVASLLGVAAAEASDRVSGLLNDSRDAERARRRTLEELAGLRVANMHQAVAPDGKGIHWLVQDSREGSVDELRLMAQAAMELPRAVFIGLLRSTGQIIVASSGDSGFDAGNTLRAVLSAAGGRGGGSSRLAQGSVPASSHDTIVSAIQQS